jgi:glutathione peroxidase
MKLFTCFLFLALYGPPTSIYSFEINAADSNTINFNDFRDKKILLVNIATGSDKVDQLGELQKLQQRYADSLVIVGFPSNSFGNEARSNAEIRQFCQSVYRVSFLLASKGSVKGEDIQPLYSWVTQENENGIASSGVKGDFQKYLIGSNGELLGIFAASVSPLSQELVSAILTQ